MNTIAKFWKLPFATKRLLIASFVRLAAVSASLHLMSGLVGRRQWAVALQQNIKPYAKTRAYDRETIAWAVAAASRFVPGSTCLVQAIVGQRLLLRSGYPAEVKVGVTRDDRGAFAAHAWLVSEGHVILGRDLQREYSEMPAIENRDLT